MDYTDEELAAIAARSVEEADAEATPAFYALAGSHLHGYPDAESDVDLRGFHAVDARRYARLDAPEPRIQLDDAASASGFEDGPPVDFVSYELRQFGAQVASGDFNVVELCYGDTVVVNVVPDELDALRGVVEDRLVPTLSAAYRGMARQNYRTLQRGPPARDAKTYLYVLRGLLAARLLDGDGVLEPNVRDLAATVLGETSLVDDVVAAKCGAGTVDSSLADRLDEVVERLLETASDVSEDDATGSDARASDRDAIRAAVDNWMGDVRVALGR